MCVCVFLCETLNQSSSKKQRYVSEFSNLDAMLHKTYIKILLALRHQGSTCGDP